MANYRAIASGNWNTASTWDGGSVPPNGAGHNIYSNTFTVTIDTNVDVNFISNSSVTASFVGGGTSAAAGGGFTMPSAFNITGTLNASSQLLTVSAATGTINMNSASIAAAATTGTLRHTGAANIVINNCNITGSNGGSLCNIVNTSSGNITFNTCTILAVANAGGAYPLKNETTSTGTLTFNTCTITAGNNSAYAIGNLGAGNIVVSGGVITGAGVSTGQGILSNSTGNVTCLNVAINAGSTGVGISNGSGQLTCTGCTITASNGANAITSSGVPRISGTLISSANGTQALSSSRWILNTAPTASYIQQALDGINALSYVRYYTPDNTGLGPATSDVRSGISYGGGLVGTCAVPNAGTVAFGVAVDNTTGTATLTAANVRAALGMASANLDTQLAVLSNLDTTVSSRLAPSGTLARVTLTDTATTLTNAPVVPSASAIASQVRTELTTELGRIDQNISSRLAATAYTAPPTPPTAAQVRAEMDANSTQLAAIKSKTDALNTDRLAQTATTAIVGALIAQANS